MKTNIKPYKHKIAYYETDRMGCTHHSNYIRIMEEARMDFLDQINWGYARMEASGIISPVFEVSGQYKRQTTFDDIIEVHVMPVRVTPAKLILGYQMYVGEQLVFEGKSGHCFTNHAGMVLPFRKTFPELYQLLTDMIGGNV